MLEFFVKPKRQDEGARRKVQESRSEEFGVENELRNLKRKMGNLMKGR